MKRKLLTAMLMTLVVCLAGSMLILTACNPKPEGSTAETVKTGKMLNDVFGKLGKVGENFGVDIAANFTVDDKTAANADAVFTLTAKGNLDVRDNAAETANNFAIELKKGKGETAEVLLGLAYEVIGAEPYFYINLFNGGYVKINGTSLLGLINLIAPAEAAPAADGAIDIVALLAGILFGDNGTVDGGKYTFDFNLASFVNKLYSNIGLITDQLGVAAITPELIDTIIGALFSGLKYTKGGIQYDVISLKTLAEYTRYAMDFNGKITFNFKGDAFNGIDAKFAYASGKTPTTDFKLDMPKAFIGTTTTAINTFETLADYAAVKASEAKNLLNFNMTGSATGLDKTGGVLHRYSITMNSDINPFGLLDLIKVNTNEAIVAALKNLGYVNITIDEVNDKGEKISNILTLHSKFDEGYAILNLDAHDLYALGTAENPFKPLSLGGVYDFESLIEVIALLTAKDPNAPPAEGGIDIMGLLKSVFGLISIDNMAENGVTVDVEGLVNMLMPLLGMDPNDPMSAAAKKIILDIFGRTSDDSIVTDMNVKLQSPTFGNCAKVASNTIENTLRKGDPDSKPDYDKFSRDFIKSIKEVDKVDWMYGDQVVKTATGFDQTYEYGVSDLTINSNVIHYPYAEYQLTGLNLDGKEVKTTGFIMGSTIDPHKFGVEQKITVYFGINNDGSYILQGLLNDTLLMNLSRLLPLFGVLPYETTVTVNAAKASPIGTLKDSKGKDVNTKDGVVMSLGEACWTAFSPNSTTYIKFGVDGNYYDIKRPSMTIWTVGKDGKIDKDVTAAQQKGFTEVGVYIARFVYGDYYYVDCPIHVSETKFGKEQFSSSTRFTSLDDQVSVTYLGVKYFFRINEKNDGWIVVDKDGKSLPTTFTVEMKRSDGVAATYDKYHSISNPLAIGTSTKYNFKATVYDPVADVNIAKDQSNISLNNPSVLMMDVDTNYLIGEPEDNSFLIPNGRIAAQLYHWSDALGKGASLGNYFVDDNYILGYLVGSDITKVADMLVTAKTKGADGKGSEYDTNYDILKGKFAAGEYEITFTYTYKEVEFVLVKKDVVFAVTYQKPATIYGTNTVKVKDAEAKALLNDKAINSCLYFKDSGQVQRTLSNYWDSVNNKFVLGYTTTAKEEGKSDVVTLHTVADIAVTLTVKGTDEKFTAMDFPADGLFGVGVYEVTYTYTYSDQVYTLNHQVTVKVG